MIIFICIILFIFKIFFSHLVKPLLAWTNRLKILYDLNGINPPKIKSKMFINSVIWRKSGFYFYFMWGWGGVDFVLFSLCLTSLYCLALIAFTSNYLKISRSRRSVLLIELKSAPWNLNPNLVCIYTAIHSLRSILTRLALIFLLLILLLRL